jgi:hypothetical protein
MYFNFVIYWKKTGLLHILLQESKPFTSSDARSHDLEYSKKVKESRNRPGMAQSVPGGLGSQISMTFGT